MPWVRGALRSGPAAKLAPPLLARTIRNLIAARLYAGRGDAAWPAAVPEKHITCLAAGAR